MPTYEYACQECGHRFDIRQSWSDDPLTVCPECTGAIRRVMHPAGVIFKGSGWYITDSRKSSEPASAALPESSKKSEGGDAKSDGGDAGKSPSETTSKPKKESVASADS
jgi:putative FmdB family regulatory protein